MIWTLILAVTAVGPPTTIGYHPGFSLAQRGLLSRSALAARDARAARADGRVADAVKFARRAWDDERAVFGPCGDLASRTWEELAGCHLDAGRIVLAWKVVSDVAAAREEVHGRGDWSAVDARRVLAEIDAVAGWGIERRSALRESRKWVAIALQLDAARKRPEALAAARQAEALARAVWGEASSGHAIAALRSESIRYWIQPLPGEAGLTRALGWLRAALGPEHPHCASCLEARGRLRYFRDDDRNGQWDLEEAIRIHWRTSGRAVTGQVDLLCTARDVARWLKDLDRATLLAEELVRREAYYHGEGMLTWAAALHELGRLHSLAGRHAQAERTLARVVPVWLAAGEQDRAAQASTMIGVAAQIQGKHKEAVLAYRRSVGLEQSLKLDGTPRHGRTLLLLGGQQRQLRDFSGGMRSLRTAIAIFRKDGKPSLGMLRSALLELSNLHNDVEDRPRQREVLEEVIRIDKGLGRQDPDPYFEFASVCKLESDFKAAEAAQRQGLALLKKSGPAGELMLGKELLELSWLVEVRGDPHAAAKIADDAAIIIERRIGIKHSLYAEALMRRASIASALGEGGKSEKALEQAAAILRLHPAEKFLYADCLRDLAGRHAATGRIDTFRALSIQGIKIVEALGPANGRHHAALSLYGARLHKAGLHAEAEAILTRVVRMQMNTLGNQNRALPRNLGMLATVYSSLRRFHEADRVLAHALSISLVAHGENHPLTAHILQKLGTSLSVRGDKERAMATMRRVIRIYQRIEPDGDFLASAARILGWMHNGRAEFDAADRLFRYSLHLSKNRPRERAESLMDLGTNLVARGMPARAKPLLLQAMSWKKKVEVGLDLALALEEVARKLHSFWEPAEADSLLRESLAIRKKIQGEKHPDHAIAAAQLAAVLSMLGHLGEARTLAEQAVAILSTAAPARPKVLAEAQSTLGGIYVRQSEHLRARRFLEAALETHSSARGADRVHLAMTLQSLGLLEYELGDWARAAGRLSQAVTVARESLGENSATHAATLLNLVIVLAKSGDLAGADKASRRALAILVRVHGDSHPMYATALASHAAVCSLRGNLADAQRAYRHALAAFLREAGTEHPQQSAIRHQQAVVARRQGRFDEAGRVLGEASRLIAAHAGKDNFAWAMAASEQGLLLKDRGKAKEAALQFHEALRTTRAMADRTFAGLSERQQLALTADQRGHLDNLLSLGNAIPDEESHGQVIAWKGAVFAAQLRRRNLLRLQGDPKAKKAAAALLDASRRLANVALRTDAASRKEAARLTTLLDDLGSELAGLDKELTSVLKPPTSRQIAAWLHKDEALVDFFIYRVWGPGGKPTNRLVAWVVRKGKTAIRVELGDADELSFLSSRWRKKLDEGSTLPGVPASLREKIWDKVAPHIGDAGIVLLSPDGFLGSLSFAALPGKKKGSYLLEDVALVIVPFPRLILAGKAAPTGKASLLSVGGVDFGEMRKDEEGEPVGWGVLSASKVEADAIADAFRKRVGGSVIEFHGKKATTAAIRAALPKHRHALLSTHGFFAPGAMRNALERPDLASDSLFHKEGISGWHPGLLSGLVLAGANKLSDDDGGILTALEIAGMDLSGVDLAVLSACETGRGKAAGGEGLLGLQRAFAVAGCRGVVSSLWSVNDAATSVLMERFHHHLWAGKKPAISRVEALRQAQLDVLHHPELVEARGRKLAGKLGIRDLGKAVPLVDGGKKVRCSPEAWWAAWQLSGDWR